MASITVNDTPTEITSGAQSTDTLIRAGAHMRIIIGSSTGLTYSDGMPIDDGQMIIVPAGVVSSLVCAPGKSNVANSQSGFSA